jgi:hypothetical protein
MIIDQAPLAGNAAYLRPNPENDPANINLAPEAVTPSPTEQIGRSLKLAEGIVLQVAGVDLLIEGDDLLPLFSRKQTKLFTLEIVKEMFPGLNRDPYGCRVHIISGSGDFQRGKLLNCQVMEVDGVPTLVSTGTGTCVWASEKYTMPQTIDLTDVAWDMPLSRLTPAGSFNYRLDLLVWHDAPDQNPVTIHLANNFIGPDKLRLLEDLHFPDGAPLNKISAYALKFEAKIDHDAYMRERYSGASNAPTQGRPLLAAVNLLERVDSQYTFYSLNELAIAATNYKVFEMENGKLRRFTCSLRVPASLTREESISLRVAAGHFKNVEARLRAVRLWRPPIK